MTIKGECRRIADKSASEGIRLAGKGDICAIRKIWHDIFTSDEAYLDIIFNCLYPLLDAFVYTIDGEVVSVAFAIPIRLVRKDGANTDLTPYSSKIVESGSSTFERSDNIKKVHNGRYLYGVATIEQARGRGLSRKLVKHLSGHYTAAGEDFIITRPAEESLFPFYKAQGFSIPLYRRETTLSLKQLKQSAGYNIPDNISLLINIDYRPDDTSLTNRDCRPDDISQNNRDCRPDDTSQNNRDCRPDDISQTNRGNNPDDTSHISNDSYPPDKGYAPDNESVAPSRANQQEDITPEELYNIRSGLCENIFEWDSNILECILKLTNVERGIIRYFPELGKYFIANSTQEPEDNTRLIIQENNFKSLKGVLSHIFNDNFTIGNNRSSHSQEFNKTESVTFIQPASCNFEKFTEDLYKSITASSITEFALYMPLSESVSQEIIKKSFFNFTME